MTDTTLFNSGGTNLEEDYVSHGRGTVDFLDGIFDWVTWEHRFLFNPPAAQILSGTLTLSLRDDAREGDGGFLDWKNEYAFVWTESGAWDFGEVDAGDTTYGVNVVDALADGAFRVSIVSVWGDFYIDQSELRINYTPVPEPTTTLLLGLGLVGLAGVRRKFKQ